MTVPSGPSLDRAALDLAAVIADAVGSSVLRSPLAVSLRTYRTVDDLMRIHNLRPGKRATLEAILGMLADGGVVTESPGRRGAYRIADQPRVTGQAPPSAPALGDWLTARHIDLVWRSQQAFLGKGLAFLKKDGGHIGFDSDRIAAWRVNLTDPLYDFGRMFAVRAIARRGGRFLDLGSGMGHGAQRLAEWCDWQCEVLCVDKSADFLAVSRQLVYPRGVRVRHVERDLNTGLPPLRGESIDGVLFIGAFHYVMDKPGLLSQIWRALRPSGRLAIGHCVVETDKRDRAAQSYLFSITSERAYVVSLPDLRTMLGRLGFVQVAELDRGSQFSIVLEKPSAPARDGRVGGDG